MHGNSNVLKTVVIPSNRYHPVIVSRLKYVTLPILTLTKNYEDFQETKSELFSLSTACLIIKREKKKKKKVFTTFESKEN